MESTEVVTRLLLGSQNIDRMRQEIKQVIGLIMSCIKNNRLKEPLEGNNTQLKFDNWIFQMNSGGWIEIRYDSKRISYSTIIFSNLAHQEQKILTQDVEHVYASLPTLVENLHILFPGLEQALRPTIDASRVTFPN
jgi:hypothetical protein